MALTVNIPGQPNAGNSPKDYVQSVYNFGRMAVGAVAFGVIVFAALEYTASAGNTARQQDARDRIKEAVMGIILLFGATILFNLINPKIIAGTLPSTFTTGKLPSGAACGRNSDCQSGVCKPITIEGIRSDLCQ